MKNSGHKPRFLKKLQKLFRAIQRNIAARPRFKQSKDGRFRETNQPGMQGRRQKERNHGQHAELDVGSGIGGGRIGSRRRHGPGSRVGRVCGRAGSLRSALPRTRI